MTKYVIDASVVLKHQLEIKSDTANVFNQILNQTKSQQITLYSSPLLLLEVANALSYQLKLAHLAQETLAKIINLPIKILSLKPSYLQKSLHLAQENHTTVYDTSYHVLAISRHSTFLTADQDYYKKSHHLGSIKLLG